MTDEEFQRAKEAMLEKLTQEVAQSILYGSSLSLEEPPGHENCRCTIIMIAEPWIFGIDDAMDAAFGDTDPYIQDFRDLP